MTCCNGVAQKNQELIWPIGLLQIICFFRCLHALTSSSSSLPCCQATTKRTREHVGGNHPIGHQVGLGFFLENTQGQSDLGFSGNISLWNIALHGHWLWEKWCISIITKINAFRLQACFWAFSGAHLFSINFTEQYIKELKHRNHQLVQLEISQYQ